MENASKALLMAAGMLIALIIISALLLMFNNLSNYQQGGTQDTREAQIVDFNNQFETYNRDDVRGSDLYSLVNRVVDYNKRKSTEGLGLKDEGRYLAYEPMTIKFTIQPLSLLSKDGTNRLITGNGIYTISQTTNNFDGVYRTIKIMETSSTDGYGDKQTIQNLCTAIDKIFIDSSKPIEDKRDAIISFNSAAYGKKSYSYTGDINLQFNTMINENKDKVYKYYEYVQFKRARFECVNTEYNQETGRIKLMEFRFTGRFE